jgi:hypothetical protein
MVLSQTWSGGGWVGGGGGGGVGWIRPEDTLKYLIQTLSSSLNYLVWDIIPTIRKILVTLDTVQTYLVK